MIKALTELFRAATAFLRVWPLWKIHQMEKRYEELEDEIMRLGNVGDAASKLRIGLLHNRRQRLAESISTLRSADSDPDRGS